MSDEVQNYRGTVGYTRKVNLGDYSSAEASIFVQFDLVPEHDDINLASAQDAFNLAKFSVFSNLGIVFDVEGGAPVERIAAPVAAPVNADYLATSFPGSTVVPNVPATSSGGVACPKCGGSTYDNRETKKSAKQPDYRCKNYNKTPACDGVVWPPRV